MAYHKKNPILSLDNIKLNVDGHSVIDGLSLDIYAGEIHAIVGDHDSGKTYIGEVLSGIIQPNEGLILLDGKTRQNLNISRSQKLGIQTVHQDTFLIDNFTIAQNLFTPSILGDKLRLNKSKMIQGSRSILTNFGFNLDPIKLYKDLYLSEKIVINIIRALIRKPRILILDESLEKLSVADLQKISQILKARVKEGMAILCFSHKIDDIYNFADYVSILRGGQIFLTDSVDNIDRLNLIKLCYTQLSSGSDMTNTSKEFYQLLKYNEAILQKLPTNLIVTDDNNRIKLINNTARDFFSLKDRVLRGERLELLLGNDNDRLIRDLERAFIEKQEAAGYNISCNIGGNLRIINFKTFPIYDGAFLIGNILIIEDISEQEKLREQINLSEKLASVGLLAAGVAHEINNPLEIIYNHLSYLNMNTQNGEYREVIAEIEDELRDIKVIVSNLISFSDHNNTSRELYNLNDLIDSLVNLIRFNARHKQISIVFNKKQSEIMVKGSRNEMKQVFLNLFKNSFEAMPDGGSITIVSDLIERDDSELVMVSIEDTGHGIDEEHTKEIFLPFFSTKKKTEHNMGLGLSVIYGILKKYQGEISVSNRKEGGCKFLITLPTEVI